MKNQIKFFAFGLILFSVFFGGSCHTAFAQKDIHDTWIVKIKGQTNEIRVREVGKKKKTKIYVNDEVTPRFAGKIKGVYYVGGDPLEGMSKDDDFRVKYIEASQSLQVLDGKGNLIATAVREGDEDLSTSSSIMAGIPSSQGKQALSSFFGSSNVNLIERRPSSNPLVINLHERNGKIWAVWGNMDNFDTLKAAISGQQLIVYHPSGIGSKASIYPESGGYTVKYSNGEKQNLLSSSGEMSNMEDAIELMEALKGNWIIPNEEKPDFSLEISGVPTRISINWKDGEQTQKLQGKFNRNATGILGYYKGKKQLILRPKDNRLMVQSGNQPAFQLVKEGTAEDLFSNPMSASTPNEGSQETFAPPIPPLPSKPKSAYEEGNFTAHHDAMVGVWSPTGNRKINQNKYIMEIRKTPLGRYMVVMTERVASQVGRQGVNMVSYRWEKDPPAPLQTKGFIFMYGKASLQYVENMDRIVVNGKERLFRIE